MDDQLVRRAARGDAEAFDALARDRIDRLFAIAFRILRDHHDAEDAVQQALWTAWADLPGLREPERFDAWLYRLVVRMCYRAVRSRRRRASIVQLPPAPDMLELPGTQRTDAIADRDELEAGVRLLEHGAPRGRSSCSTTSGSASTNSPPCSRSRTGRLARAPTTPSGGCGEVIVADGVPVTTAAESVR